MPQKGQITKHEWVRCTELEQEGFSVKIFECPHCLNYKREHPTEPLEFFRMDMNFGSWVEPQCITRKTQTDVDKCKGVATGQG